MNAGNEFLQVTNSHADITHVYDLVEDRAEVVSPLTAAMDQLPQRMEIIKEMMTAKSKKRDSLTSWYCGPC